ncbi:ExbD/TolR family protein [Halopseudomonas salegens]|uniref:Outer membrane transport energization protein ExbD n=1 Tax=Halopseudomonas salegens TaxID=1434072 RepID=A0A1H2DW36_9GAMM|nr:biopolymer transporter ExbD [Halopseudomonas salegens]SDT87050.1 outer membrane transport energization protein ExbD [Halopseudomonas salegens]
MIQLPERAPASSLLADLTPLLDVIFIVLVFFLLTAQTPLLQVPLQLPSSEDSASAAPDNTIPREQLMLYADGRWQLGEREFAHWRQLRSAAPFSSATALDIAVEQGAQADDLLRLLAWLSAREITDTRLLMEFADD